MAELTTIDAEVAEAVTDAASMSVDAETLASIVDAIDAAVSPLEIILFGSQARGDARPDSDVDLLVVVHDGAPRMAIAKQAYRALRHAQRHAAGVDIVVTTPDLRRRKMLVPSSIITHAMQDAIVLRRGNEVLA